MTAVLGGEGNDWLDAGDGGGTLVGGDAGNDNLFGGPGDDNDSLVRRLAMTASLLALVMTYSMVVQVPRAVTGQKTLIRALMLRLKSTVRLEKQ